MINRYDALTDRKTEVVSFYNDFVDARSLHSTFDSLSLYLDEDSFEAYDSNYPNLYFKCKIVDLNGEKSLHFGIKSKEGQDRSPYLFAKELCDVAFRHFSKKYNLIYLAGMWYADSDNYRQFF